MRFRIIGLITVLSFVHLNAQNPLPFPKVSAVSENPPPPPTPIAPVTIHKRNWLKRLFADAPTVAPAPVGVQVVMSDGTIQTFPLGVWIEFASGGSCSPSCPSGGQLRGIFPTQYVNQIAIVNNGPFGTGASATVTVNAAGGTAPTTLSFAVGGGSGYILPMISITGGTGTPGVVTATVVNGIITSISAPNATGYSVGDVLTVTITDIPQIWAYPKPGRNVQVWRNGVLQRLGPDYTLNSTTGYIIPVLYTDPTGTVVAWNTTDYVSVAYLY